MDSSYKDVDTNVQESPAHDAPTGASMEIIKFEQFDTSFAVNPSDEGNVRRRFMTLLTPNAQKPSRLADCEVLHVQNTEGEWFALKRLQSLPADVDPFARRGREAALFEEYRNQLAVSHLQGFPRVYGYGVTPEGDPGILMEWIDGMTLLDANQQSLLPSWEGGGHPGATVAAVGLSVLQALISTSYLEGTFAHRDISPRNIMLRANAGTDHPLDWRQGEPIECCLIDLGSAIFMRRDEATFTMTMDVWRNATPEYAPPEMLALNDRSYIEARRSPLIDIYALCSVLYELYSGRTPYNLAALADHDDFQVKTAGAPPIPTLHQPQDKALVDAIMAGLSIQQAGRPDATSLFHRLADWQQAATGKTTTVRRQMRPPKSVGVHLWTTHQLENVPEGTPPTTVPSSAQHQRIDAENPAVVTPASSVAPHGHGIQVTRRGLLIGAGCVAGAAILGGAAWATEGFGLLHKHTFGDNSWDQIAQMASQIAAASSHDDALAIAQQNGIANDNGSIADGLTKSIQLADGTQASVQVVDYYHDDLSSGGKAGLTFAFTEPVAAMPMANEAMPTGGWQQCDLRSWLNSDFVSLLPQDLASHVSPVMKVTNNVGAQTSYDPASITATEDELWLFSMVELGGPKPAATMGNGFGYLSDILSAEGTQYQLWKDLQVSTTAKQNDGTERTWNGTRCYWWTRSPSPDCSTNDGQTWFNRVGPNGDVFSFAVAATGDQNASTVLPGFCI
ncbi:MAG: DUF6273 domain-containing protein [Atopobiaceae bacterium]